MSEGLGGGLEVVVVEVADDVEVEDVEPGDVVVAGAAVVVVPAVVDDEGGTVLPSPMPPLAGRTTRVTLVHGSFGTNTITRGEGEQACQQEYTRRQRQPSHAHSRRSFGG